MFGHVVCRDTGMLLVDIEIYETIAWLRTIAPM